jgi:ribosome biogenesis GTPase A
MSSFYSLLKVIRQSIIQIGFQYNIKYIKGKRMKLKEYLETKELTQEKFIQEMEDQTGHKLSQGGLSKYVLEYRIPRKAEMVAIHEYTKGEVEPNDFYLE